MSISASSYLDVRNVQGTRVYGIRGTDWTLVKRNDQTGSFEPVDKLDGNISAQELDAKYGVWTDKQVTRGHLWWKTVEREKDGKVQADEVVDFPTFRQSQYSSLAHRSDGNEYFTFDKARIRIASGDGGDKIPVLDSSWTETLGASYGGLTGMADDAAQYMSPILSANAPAPPGPW